MKMGEEDSSHSDESDQTTCGANKNTDVEDLISDGPGKS